MRLVKTVYIKVSEGLTDYFIKERSYLSRCDGKILRDFITEETFNRNLEKGKKIEVYNFENAPLGVRRRIEREIQDEVS